MLPYPPHGGDGANATTPPDHPVHRPRGGCAGRAGSGAELLFARTNGEVGTSGHIYLNNSSGSYRGRRFAAPPGAGGQLVLAVTASGGRGTVLAASFSSHRLYAVADL